MSKATATIKTFPRVDGKVGVIRQNEKGRFWVLEFDGFRVGSYDLWKAEELMAKWLEPETAEAERLDILGLGS